MDRQFDSRSQRASGDPEWAAFFGLVAEYSFVLLPLIVLALTWFLQGHFGGILSSPEWSFAAAILFGQTIVKFVSGITNLGYKIHWQAVAVVVSLIIVLGLVPSLVVLVLAMLNTKTLVGVSAVQFFLFCLATVTFLTVGRFGQVLLRE